MSGMTYTGRYAWVPLRAAEVTADDTALDGTAVNGTYYDLTRKDCFELPPEADAVQFIFGGQGDASDSFNCKLYGKSHGGPAELLATFCGHYGTAHACNSVGVVDGTTKLLCEQIVLDGTNTFHTGDVSVADMSNNRAARLTVRDVAGLKWLYPEFANVGDTTEAHGVQGWARWW